MKYTCMYEKTSNIANMRNMFRKDVSINISPTYIFQEKRTRNVISFLILMSFDISNPFFMSQL